jgi:CheY-like chemotaxis protein
MTKRAAEQGSELVKRLLAFARRQRLEPHAIDLRSLRDSVSDLLTHTLGGLVNIEWQVGPDVWPAFADQTQLELALVNLIINSRDAMPSGGTVTISAKNNRLRSEEIAGLEAGEYVRLAISDNGDGIAPEALEKVLEPFFTTKDFGKGSGLGLSMVYGFAKQSNGAFRIDSQLGEGTTAELWLPRAPSPSDKDIRPGSKRKRQSKTRKLRLLLVDDHVEVRCTTAAVLQELGHTVFQAANGTEALKILKEEDCRCELLISDYAMPHLSGTEFLRAARELCPNIPALMITGYADADAISDPPEGVEILLKPFTPSALDAAIARSAGSGEMAG